MDLGVAHKAYVIVGGSRGMGWETGRILAENGANLAIISRDPDAIRHKTDELAKRCKVKVKAIGGDVLCQTSIEAAVEKAIVEIGPIRGLAVTNYSKSHSSAFIEMYDEEWDFLYQDVFMGTVRSCRAILPHLLSNGGGQIVVTSAYSARAPKAFLFGYAAFKAALLNFTKNLAKTYGSQGIRANAVCPGYIETGRSTEKIASLLKDGTMKACEAERILLDRAQLNVALGRLGRPAELGEMMAFLLSERAGYATGMIANVDGGTDF
jgi:NAD(P)-dependent dehydrogenase (short-subunit alcohol dehydrogenase family)